MSTETPGLNPETDEAPQASPEQTEADRQKAVEAVADQQDAAQDVQKDGDAEQAESAAEADNMITETFKNLEIKEKADVCTLNLLKIVYKDLQRYEKSQKLSDSFKLPLFTLFLKVLSGVGSQENAVWSLALMEDSEMKTALEKGIGLKVNEKDGVVTHEWVKPDPENMPPIKMVKLFKQEFGLKASGKLISALDKETTFSDLYEKIDTIEFDEDEAYLVKTFLEAAIDNHQGLGKRSIWEIIEVKRKGVDIQQSMKKLIVERGETDRYFAAINSIHQELDEAMEEAPESEIGKWLLEVSELHHLDLDTPFNEIIKSSAISEESAEFVQTFIEGLNEEEKTKTILELIQDAESLDVPKDTDTEALLEGEQE